MTKEKLREMQEAHEPRNCVRCGGLNMDHLSHCEKCRTEDWCCSDGWPLPVEEAYALRNERDELRAEVERLRKQRDKALAFIAETDNSEAFREWQVFSAEGAGE